MSYDISFIPVAPGEDPAAAHRKLMEQDEANATDLETYMRRPIAPEVRAAMQRFADSIRTQIPTLEQFNPDQPLPWIELNDTTCEVQVAISERAATLTMPYFRQGSEMMERARQCVQVICAVTGYTAFDPQLEIAITPADFSVVGAKYRSMDAALPQILRKRGKPWWKFWA